MKVFRGKTPEDCQQHMELHQRIDALERRIKVLECGGEHDWEKYFPMHGIITIPRSVHIRCKKCGTTKLMSALEWKDYELDRALDEVERLGGEVTR